MLTLRNTKKGLLSLAVLLAALMSAGCPPPGGGDPQDDYDTGFLEGFGEDGEYWTGFWDSYDTVDDSPIYYTGDTIPFVEDPPYESGYWDGVWYAYHDGYFVSYKYAFVLGWSEGYDNGYWPDYLDFLDDDTHIEFLNGGFGDGYHDGFSEGRVFGAADFEADIDFDWLGALLEYESGVDLNFAEIGVGTGAFGPVTYYEYGTDPNDLTKALRKAMARRHLTPTVRAKAVDVDDLELYRPLTQDAKNEFSVSYETSLRSDRELLLTSTYLQRIQAYLSADVSRSAGIDSSRAASKRAVVIEKK